MQMPIAIPHNSMTPLNRGSDITDINQSTEATASTTFKGKNSFLILKLIDYSPYSKSLQKTKKLIIPSGFRPDEVIITYVGVLSL